MSDSVSQSISPLSVRNGTRSVYPYSPSLYCLHPSTALSSTWAVETFSARIATSQSQLSYITTSLSCSASFSLLLYTKTVPYPNNRKSTVPRSISNQKLIADCVTPAILNSLRNRQIMPRCFVLTPPCNLRMACFQASWLSCHFLLTLPKVFQHLNTPLIPFPSFGAVHTTASFMYSGFLLSSSVSICAIVFSAPDGRRTFSWKILVNTRSSSISASSFPRIERAAFLFVPIIPRLVVVLCHRMAHRIQSPNSRATEKMYLPSRNSKSKPAVFFRFHKHIMARVYFVADCLKAV